jgi:hypothetical protein
MVSTTHAVQTPTVVLYDIMCEAANRVRGRIVRLHDENPSGAEGYKAQLIDLQDRVDAVDVDDRVAIAAMTTQLRSEYDGLLAV